MRDPSSAGSGCQYPVRYSGIGVPLPSCGLPLVFRKVSQHFFGIYCSQPGTRCTGVAIPLDHTSLTESAILSFWVIQCLHRYAQANALERSLQLRFGVRPTLEMSVIGYKPMLNWRIAGRQGPFLTVGEVIQFHWEATARLKLSSHQPIRFCPATGHLPHVGAWVSGYLR